MNLGTPPLFGVSGYLVRPKNSGVPLMDGVPLLYREDPPKFGGPVRTPKLRDPLAVPWVPWSHVPPPPKFRGPPLIYGLPGYLGLP